MYNAVANKIGENITIKSIEIVIFGGTDRETKSKNKRFFSKLLKAYSENGIEGMAKNIDFAIHYIYFVSGISRNYARKVQK